MKIEVHAPEQLVIWQCIFHALEDYRNDPKKQTTYEFEIPNGEAVTVTIKKNFSTYRVDWKKSFQVGFKGAEKVHV